LAERVLEGESVRHDVELSVLYCDDEQIRELNRTYRGKDSPTDVLSFNQYPPPSTEHASALGDIVISLETVDRRCGGDAARMQHGVRLLFCHGLLHLLGYDHANTAGRKRMAKKQAEYLGLPLADAWPE
jgi:probable rRNA maturation factor